MSFVHYLLAIFVEVFTACSSQINYQIECNKCFLGFCYASRFLIETSAFQWSAISSGFPPDLRLSTLVPSSYRVIESLDK